MDKPAGKISSGQPNDLDLLSGSRLKKGVEQTW
jgi:hypothetical protein